MSAKWNYNSDNEDKPNRDFNKGSPAFSKSRSGSVSINNNYPQDKDIVSDGMINSSQKINNRQPRTNKPTPEPSNCIGVFGLSKSTDEITLKKTFDKFGSITTVKLIMDKFQNVSLCFGFITFDNIECATRAVKEANGMSLDGKDIRVDYSITKKAYTPTPGGYKGKRISQHAPKYNDNKRGLKRSYNDRSRSRSPYKRRSVMRCLNNDDLHRRRSPMNIPERFDPRGYSPRRHDPRRYSPMKSDPRHYSPVRNDIRRYSPMRGDIRRYSPMRNEIKRYSPMRNDTRRYSPVRNDVRRISPVRTEGRFVPIRNDSRVYSPVRNEIRRYSPMRTERRYSPVKTDIRRYSPPRNDPRRFSPSRNDGRGFLPVRNDIRKYSPTRNEFRKYSPVRNEIRKYSPIRADVRKYSPMRSEVKGSLPMRSEIHKFSDSKPIHRNRSPAGNFKAYSSYDRP